MKKIIILLTLPFVLLMANFTLTGKELTSADQITQSSTPAPATTPVATNSYLEAVNLPKCNVKNPEVQFIKSNADWKMINSSSKRVFCVSPGDYRGAGTITLTASGTADARRYIILNNGNNAHPASLPETQQANVQIDLVGANYWVVDRISTLHPTQIRAVSLRGNSTHNIMNRMNIRYFNKNAFAISNGSHYNTIQKCRIADQVLYWRKKDGVGIVTYNAAKWDDPTYVFNTKIIQNEFVNVSDSVQLPMMFKDYENSIQADTGYNGTIIDSNQMHLTPDIYTDGHGHPDPNGEYVYAENAIDIKKGSDDANNKVIITNNIMWGYRESDKTGSSLGDPGTALVVHYGTDNTVIDNNYIFDSNRGINIGDARGSDHAFADSSVSHNILRDIRDFGLVIWSSRNITIDGNSIEGATHWGSFTALTNSTFTDTEIINSGDMSGSLGSGTTASSTKYYTSLLNTNKTDLTLRIDNYSTKPRDIILHGAK